MAALSQAGILREILNASLADTMASSMSAGLARWTRATTLVSEGERTSWISPVARHSPAMKQRRSVNRDISSG